MSCIAGITLSAITQLVSVSVPQCVGSRDTSQGCSPAAEWQVFGSFLCLLLAGTGTAGVQAAEARAQLLAGAALCRGSLHAVAGAAGSLACP